ncbi:MAG TPA: hypothetical protein VH253_03605 [Phycisphaerae bacterium]|nr:hypothetical protein [Phycisphaerae bacterium]
MINVFRRLLRIFNPTRRAPRPAASDTTPEWLPPGHPLNPSSFPILDVSRFTASLVSVTENPAVALSFNSLRTDDGRHLQGMLPESSIAIPCDLPYPLGAPMPPDGPIFRSRKMEEKWDLSLFDNRLYFSRSWTGALVYVAEAHITPSLLHIHTLHTALTADSPENRHFETLQMAFLLITLLFRKRLPAPIPDAILSPDLMAQVLFSAYGSQVLAAAAAEHAATFLLPTPSAPPPSP